MKVCFDWCEMWLEVSSLGINEIYEISKIEKFEVIWLFLPIEILIKRTYFKQNLPSSSCFGDIRACIFGMKDLS